MKKLFLIVAALLIVISTTAIAESANLESFGYDELVSLKNQLNLAIWNSKDWKEVTVPQGIWEVGKDIPAGHWTIRASQKNYAMLVWCSSLNEFNSDYEPGTVIARGQVVSESRAGYDASKDRSTFDCELSEGTFIIIDRGSVVFTPYEGKPAFIFD